MRARKAVPDGPRWQSQPVTRVGGGVSGDGGCVCACADREDQTCAPRRSKETGRNKEKGLHLQGKRLKQRPKARGDKKESRHCLLCVHYFLPACCGQEAEDRGVLGLGACGALATTARWSQWARACCWWMVSCSCWSCLAIASATEGGGEGGATGS